MTAIAISLLFGMAAFFSLLTIKVSLLFGTTRGLAIVREIAQIDARYGKRSRFSLSGQTRKEAFTPLWPQPSADA